jgi:predicted KAP-like P-loop ATPase
MVQQDLPIENKKQDRLGRSDFAAELANALVVAELSAGFTVGLYGKWGSGKTSVLNMLSESLVEHSDNTTVVRFNPWLCGDSKQMVEQFFELLARKTSAVKLKRKMRKYAKTASVTLSAIPYDKASAAFALIIALIGVCGYILLNEAKWVLAIATISAILTFVMPIIKTVIDTFVAEKSLQNQKDEIVKVLAKQKQKIFVLIDDIDRLSSDEITAVFQLVRSLADFPNVIYLLAFDRDVVVNVLKKVQEGDGGEYLEKIVQYPIELPIARGDMINEILIEKLDAVITTPFDRYSQEHFNELFANGLLPTIQSVRDVVRFTNALSIKYALVKDETNIVDLLGVTCLQVFFPHTYNLLPIYKDDLCGTALSTRNITLAIQGSDKKKARLTFINEEIAKTVEGPDKESVTAIISLLFPRLSDDHWNSSADMPLINKRICDEHCFDRYFTLGLESEAVPSAVINELFEIADEKRISEILIELSEQRKLEVLFRHIKQHFEQNSNSENINTRAIALLNQIFVQWVLLTKNYKERAILGLGFDEMNIAYGTKPLLQRIDTEERLGLIVSVINGNALPLKAAEQLLTIFEWENGRLSSESHIRENRLFNEEQLTSIEKAFFQRVSVAIYDGSIWGDIYLGRVLYILKELNNAELYDKLIQFIKSEIAGSDYKLLEWLCACCVSKGTTYSGKKTWKTWSVNFTKVADDVCIDFCTAYTRLVEFVKTADFTKAPEYLQLDCGAFLLGYEYTEAVESQPKEFVWEKRQEFFGDGFEGLEDIKESAIRNKLQKSLSVINADLI